MLSPAHGRPIGAIPGSASISSFELESTASVDGVKKNVQAIQDDLGKIKDAQGDLNAERKQQVQSANEAFTQQVKSITSSVTSNLSLSGAGTQLKTAATQLANSYQQTLGKIDCS